MRRQQALAVAAAALIPVLALGALAGCGASASHTSAQSAGGTTADLGGPATGKVPSDAHAAEAVDILDRQVISTGRIVVESKDVAQTRQKVFDLVDGWRGEVSNEQANSDPDGTMRRTHLVLRVPSGSFDIAMAALARTGHAVSQRRSAQDVTTQVIDTDARVQAKRRAVQQLEALLNRADTLGQVIRLEGDISDRQAELESLQQQQRWLRDQTAMSTIDMRIDRAPRATAAGEHRAGLFAGLAGGWQALGVVVTWLLTAFGAALPFAVVLLAFGAPAWLWRRRRRQAA
jgi:hypothetical protein